MNIPVVILLLLSSFTAISAQNILWETYNKNGRQAYESGRYLEAEKLLKAALSEAENLKDSNLIALSNEHLGALFATQKKDVEAEQYLLKAIEIRDRNGDSDTDEITYPLSNLGLIYAERKKYSQAESLLRRAISIREKTGSPDIAVALLNLGKVYAEQKKTIEAEAIYRKAFESFLAADDLNVEGIINCANNLSLIYEELNDYKKLEASYHILIAIIEKNYGKNDLGLVPYLEKYSSLLKKLKRNAEARIVDARITRLKLLKTIK